MLADLKLYHKSRTPEMMFLTVTARPSIEYGFDRKNELWSFAVVRKARRSDVRTGTDAGKTEIMECYREFARISPCYAEEGQSF